MLQPANPPTLLNVAQAITLRSGFTLIELMLTMSIVSILLMMGMPSMRDFIVETRLSVSVNQFIAAATFARTEAIKRGRSVVLCRSVDAEFDQTARCAVSMSEGRSNLDWGSGWIVKVESDDQVLLRQGALNESIIVLGKNRAIKYDGLGRPGSTFTSLVFSDNKKFERILCINRSGRMRVLPGKTECK
ncbi:GspH/FimT family pseudopilin [Glaciimonas sp. GG7]